MVKKFKVGSMPMPDRSGAEGWRHIDREVKNPLVDFNGKRAQGL